MTKVSLKTIFLMTGSFLLITSAIAQVNNDLPDDVMSFENLNKKNFPDLKYLYSVTDKIHDYSGNWDFDGDGEKDGLYFIGNDGAHVYFYLRIILSSDKRKQDFPFLLIDMPFLVSKDELSAGDPLGALPQFIVSDFNSDSVPEIYLNMDDVSFPAKWRKRGVTSGRILLSYKAKELCIINYKGN